MSRSGRGVVEHESASRIRGTIGNLPDGVNKALEKVQDFKDDKKEEERAPIPDGFKNLTLFGRLTEDMTFGPYIFKISTLNVRQQKEILKKIFPLSNEEKIANLKLLTLSEAIVSVNGAPLESLYFGENYALSASEKRSEVILELQASIVDKMFERYESLVKDSNAMTSGGLGESSKN